MSSPSELDRMCPAVFHFSLSGGRETAVGVGGQIVDVRIRRSPADATYFILAREQLLLGRLPDSGVNDHFGDLVWLKPCEQ